MNAVRHEGVTSAAAEKSHGIMISVRHRPAQVVRQVHRQQPAVNRACADRLKSDHSASESGVKSPRTAHSLSSQA